MKNSKIYVNYDLYSSDSMEPILDFLLTKKNIFKFYLNFKKINHKNDYISIYLSGLEENNGFSFPLFAKNIVSALKEYRTNNIFKKLFIKHLIKIYHENTDYCNKTKFKFANEELDLSFSYYYNGEKNFKTKNILDILTLPKSEFIILLKSEYLFGKSRLEYQLIFLKFCDLYYRKLKEEFYLQDDIYDNLNYLRNFAVNHHGIGNCYNKQEKLDNPKYVKNSYINKEFKDQIIASIPKEFDDLQKAFYVYIQLCFNLTYDEEYLIQDVPKEKYSYNHTNLNRIPFIDKNNSKVVCFEFNLIYIKILEELGITCFLNTKDNYGNVHNEVLMLINNILIKADATIRILNGDMACIKNNIMCENFQIISGNIIEKEYFDSSIQAVYKYTENKKHINFYSNNNIINYLREKYKVDSLSIHKRIRLFFSLVKDCKMEKIDKLKNINILYNVFFKRVSCVEYCILNDNNNVRLVVVFIIKFKNTNLYYLLDEENNIKHISSNYLQEQLDCNFYRQNKQYKKEIPGINNI